MEPRCSRGETTPFLMPVFASTAVRNGAVGDRVNPWNGSAIPNPEPSYLPAYYGRLRVLPRDEFPLHSPHCATGLSAAPG